MKTKNTTKMSNDDDGLVGNANGTGRHSEGFQKLKMAIRDRASGLKPEERLQIELKAVKYRMQSYLHGPAEAPIPTGYFIKECLDATGVQLKSFASYLNSNSGNVSKIINGERKINLETAMILGQTFETEPELWLQIQDKNEIMELKKINKDQFRRYSLDTLMQTKVIKRAGK